jgi:hypothetical protein
MVHSVGHQDFLALAVVRHCSRTAESE